MTSASEFQTLSDSLFHWSAYDPGCKCELSSTAIRSNASLVVIDPIPLAEAAWKELLQLAPLRAILLTNGNHVRDADRLRQKHQIPIVTAPLARRAVTELKPDVVLLEGELLYGITPISVPGAASGETAFFFASGGVMAIGDAAINLSPEKGLELLPDKYCDDPEQNRASLRKLLNFDFRTLTFAHGTPVTSRAQEKWRALLSP
jgi:glyoxylase-like metal-dependent hydrolase (beta-lactamase superfamily II)